MKLNQTQFSRAVPHASTSIVLPLIDEWNRSAEKFGIVTAKHSAWFLGRAAVETWAFTRLEENLYYTHASTIRHNWPTRFKTDDDAAPFVRNPEGLANKVYGGRLGNDTNGDGWDYRGSGILQTTGEANFKEVEAQTGIKCVSNPSLLRKMPDALTAAFVYWQNRNCNRYVDAGDVMGLVKAIQGGTAGAEDTAHYIALFMPVLVDPLPSGVGPRTVKIGSTGSDVMTLQQKLSALHLYGGKIDGNFGQGTQNAVVAFQKSRGLIPVDGIVGPATWKVILA